MSEREDDLGGCSLLTEGSLLKEGVLSFSLSLFSLSPNLCLSLHPSSMHTHTHTKHGGKKKT